MFDLKIVSTLEIEIIVEHVGGDLDETGSKKSKEECRKVEDMGHLKRNYTPQNYWDKGRLQERDAHGPEP